MRQILPKFIALAAIFGLLVVMLSYITSLVQGREHYRDQAVQSIVQGTAGPQMLLGPLLAQSCTETWTSKEEGNAVAHKQDFVHITAPANLTVDNAQVQITPLHRGIFTANTFSLTATVRAEWRAPLAPPESSYAHGVVKCAAPRITLAVGDARGIRSARIQLNKQALAVMPGTGLMHFVNGLQAELPPELLTAAQGGLHGDIQIELIGTDALALVPLAESNEVALSGNWQHPAFGGRFLPNDRNVGTKGFAARWAVSSLASTAFDTLAAGGKFCGSTGEDSYSERDTASAAATAEAVVDATAAGPVAQTAQITQISKAGNKTAILRANSQGGGCIDAFHVRFIDPVNTYSLADRATKYGLLFVVLTFVAVGMFEVLKQLRVHPVQYLLVGSALSSFFLLLLSLSEHLRFGVAYAIAAAACVLLLTYYASHMLRGLARGVPFGAGIALLYGLLYVLLQLEQTALLAGSIALFAVLALVMVITRKIDWYAQLGGDALFKRRHSTPSDAPDLATPAAPEPKPDPTALWNDE